MKQMISILMITLATSIAIAQDDDRYFENKNQNTQYNYYEKDYSITPSLQILNFPHPFNGGLEIVFSRVLGIKYQKSFRPNKTIDGSTAELDDQSFSFRSYPNQGPWFLGLGYGKHRASVKNHEIVNGFDTNIYANVDSEYITPTTGLKWIYNSGFTIGVEIGWIFPINNRNVDVYSDQDGNPFVNANEDYRQRRQDAEDAANKYVENGVISIGLLELGWTF